MANTAPRLQQIREETANDPILSKLLEVVHNGWPDKREKYPQVLHDYWNFCEELTIEDGLLLKGSRIIIPTTIDMKCRTLSPRTPRAGEVLTQSKDVNLLAWDYQRYHQHCKRV